MVGGIDIRELNLNELTGVVNIYPWFSAARAELCSRMQEMGALDRTLVSQTSLHMGSRKLLSDLVRSGRKEDYSDLQAGDLLRTYLAEAAEDGESAAEAADDGRKVVVVGGDYFSQEAYNNVRRSEDNIFSSFAVKARAEGYTESDTEDLDDICTETLAGIYLEQGYFAEAKKIYSKLSLRYPEKSIYFAALIEKIDKNN